MTSLNAVTLAVTLSLLLLLSGARPDPDLAEDSAVVSVAVRDPQEGEIETTTVDLRRPIHLAAVDPDDLSRQIAHSFRLPLSRHVSACPLRHEASLRPTIEIPYGDDMIGLPKADDKTKKKKKMKTVRDVDDDSDSDDDPYGDDMIGLPKADDKTKKKKKMKTVRDVDDDSDSDDDDDSDSDSDDDDDDFETEQHKKMKKRLKKMMKKKPKKEENSGFMNWISGFLNRL